MSFYEYLLDIEKILYYNFLTDKEFDSLYERYEEFLENI